MKFSFKCTGRACFIGSVFLFSPILAIAEQATDESVREFIRLSGAESAEAEYMESMLPYFKSMAKDMPDDLFRELTRTDNLVEGIIPIYRKYLTEDDLRNLIDFYKTPTGQKLSKVSGKMAREVAERAASAARMTITNYYIQRGKFTIEKKEDGDVSPKR